MARYNVTIPEFLRKLATMTPDMERAAIRGLRGGAMHLQRVTISEIDQATPYPAVDTGELRNSVALHILPKGAEVAVEAPHAAFIEYGTRPHTPPLAPLLEWAQRKGLGAGAARAVQKKIAKEGTRPRPYFAQAVERSKPMIEDEVMEQFARLGYGRIKGR